ncbi:MAG: hypothetical protein ABI832_03120 [bacterium]
MADPFPPLAEPEPVQTRVLARPVMPTLPWLELGLGVAMLQLLRGF